MKYLLNAESVVLGAAFAFLLSAPTTASEPVEVHEVDIQECFELEYDAETMTPDTAFQIAECFSRLANTIVDSQSDEFIADTELWSWDDKNVLLHYADSWFSYAAYRGHPEASAHLESTRKAFE